MTDTAQNTALAVHDGGQQPKPPTIPKVPLTAGNLPRAIVPVDFEGAYRIANVVTTAGMAPKTLNTVEKAMVAILHGLEVGLTPMNALQSIAVINGRPTIWGDGAIGLIRASGLLEWMEEKFEGEGENLVAVCIVKRKGEPRPVRGEFSWKDAKKANLLGKDGPWQTYPRRMMQMRARWPLRDVFADVLKGLRLREEEEDLARSQETPAEAQPERRRVPPPPPAEGAETAAAAETSTAETEMIDETTGEVSNEPAQATATHTDVTSGMKTTATAVRRTDPISSGPAGGFPGDKPMKSAAPPPDDGGGIPWALDRKLSDDDRDWLMSLKETFEQCEDIEQIAAEQDSIMAPAHDTVSPYAWKKASDLMDDHIERVQRG